MAEGGGPVREEAGRPGRLTLYLGSAPGVGKTSRMLGEGHRRAECGTDVVVGYVDCHERRGTEALLRGLLVIPRVVRSYRDRLFGEMDLDGLLVLRPETVLVDELAHTNLPGARHSHRWQDVQELLTVGIDVVTTLNVHQLASLSHVAEEITGTFPRETVPDEVLARADRIELVDVDPETLRRRVADGQVVPPDLVDAALSHFFRPANLTTLRELAALCATGHLAEARLWHGAGQLPPETRGSPERVVIALPGGPEGETLIRRAARIVRRSPGGDLLAVHVVHGDGLGTRGSPDTLSVQRRLTESLGGTFQTVVGDHVPTSLLDFARASHATQLVLGASSRSRLAQALGGPGTGPTTVARSGDIDVHLVAHARAGRRGPLTTKLAALLGRRIPRPARPVAPTADEAARRPAEGEARTVLEAPRNEPLPARADGPLRSGLCATIEEEVRASVSAARAAVDALCDAEQLNTEVTAAESGTACVATDRRELFDIAARALTRLDRLADDLRDLGRLHAGDLVPRPRPVRLDEVLPAALESVRSVSGRDVTLEVCGPAAAPVLLADPVFLERIVAAVLVAAAHRSPPATGARIDVVTHTDRVDLRFVTLGPPLPPSTAPGHPAGHRIPLAQGLAALMRGRLENGDMSVAVLTLPVVSDEGGDGP
ncbi:universal stress protein [Streptomyces gibsoniae]|uniref:Universal stress protein n=1 Tax=Streptomyces gibsoniae TaxID=3075529 RepID=A0ABU2U3N1_9ACTN|nr:universal stress protein [Streptomyces sp. DSM 41699]MDT0467816.1 universal stress protein [Streptomyces sp. DSM 41699]